MRLIDVHRLSGPNIYTSRPVAVARLELDGLTGQESSDCPGFARRLTGTLPGLAAHHCAAGRPGGFLDALARGTYFGHVTEHVALELSALAGREVHFGRTVWAGAEGRYDVITECPRDEPPSSGVPRDLLTLAISDGHRDAGRARDPVAGRPGRDHPVGGRGPARGEHRRPGRSRPAARHPGPPHRGPQPAPPGLRLPPPSALGGAHPEDLGGGRRHSVRQGAGQGAAGHRRSPGPRRGGGPVGRRGRRGAGHAAGPAGDQAPPRQPRRERHRGGDHPGPGRGGVPAGQHQRRSGRY